MEKKTMGSFLAALRRANGMTQKELAERLNVSDKSVSRWERDDGAPDLALIPVIAEVFGVTCDELLRGERAAAGEEQGAQSTPKGEQQKKHLLAASLSRFRSRCCIALALAAAGFLVAMAFNSALERALLGFFLGAVFFVAAAAVETVQLNAALLAIHDEEGEDVDAFRRAVVRGAERTYGAAWVLFACTLPLLLAFHPVTINGFTASRTGVGISLDFWQAALVLLTALVTGVLAVRLVERRLVKKRFLPPEEKTEAQRKNDRLLRTTALTLCAALALSAFAARALVGFGDTRLLAEGVEFTDFDSFKRYMRKPVKPAEGLRRRPPLPKARSTTRMTRRSIARRPRARPLRTTTGMCSATSSGATARSFSGGQGQRQTAICPSPSTRRRRCRWRGRRQSTSTWCSMASMLLRSSPRRHTISASAKSKKGKEKARPAAALSFCCFQM